MELEVGTVAPRRISPDPEMEEEGSKGPRGFRRLSQASTPTGGAGHGRAGRVVTATGAHHPPPLATSFFPGLFLLPTLAGANCLLPIRETAAGLPPLCDGTSACGVFLQMCEGMPLETVLGSWLPCWAAGSVPRRLISSAWDGDRCLAAELLAG